MAWRDVDAADLAEALMMGVEGSDPASIAEGGRRAAAALDERSARLDAAYREAAAARDLDEPWFGSSVVDAVAAAGGDLFKVFDDDSARLMLRDHVLEVMGVDVGHMILNDEDGIREEYVEPGPFDLRRADGLIEEARDRLVARGALDPSGQRPNAAAVDERLDALSRWVRAQGILSNQGNEGAWMRVRDSFDMGDGRITATRIEISAAWDSMTLGMSAGVPGIVTLTTNGGRVEHLTVSEAMGGVREVFPDATTPALEAAPAATVYTKDNCIACEMTKRQFSKAGVDVEVVRLEDHPEVVERAKEMGLMSAPLVATPDGRMTAGFDPQRIRDIAALAGPVPGAGPARGPAGVAPDGATAPVPAVERGRGMGR